VDGGKGRGASAFMHHGEVRAEGTERRSQRRPRGPPAAFGEVVEDGLTCGPRGPEKGREERTRWRPTSGARETVTRRARGRGQGEADTAVPPVGAKNRSWAAARVKMGRWAEFGVLGPHRVLFLFFFISFSFILFYFLLEFPINPSLKFKL
jgi:hypothetical protein